MARTMTTYHTVPTTPARSPGLQAALTSSHGTAAEAIRSLATLNAKAIYFTAEPCTNAGCIGCHRIRERVRSHRAFRAEMRAIYGPRRRRAA